MEARNFVTAREMLTDGNWVLTTMNGLPRYQKPPLPTWFSAATGELFGIENLFALRLPAALITLVLLFVMYSLSRKLTQNTLHAFLSTAVAATSFYIIFAGRNGTWDIFAHSFMLVGIYFLYQLFKQDKKVYSNALWAGVFIGLSFMSKGPVSHYALLLPFLIAYGVVYKFSSWKIKIWPLLLTITVAVLLSSWWAVYIYYQDTAEATRIAQVESGRWVGYELKPFYYYWSFFTQSGLWTIPAFIALLYPYLKSRVSNLKAYQFVWLWTILAVILLSLIPTKKSRYLLPVLIPLAFTTAFYIEYLFKNFKQITNRWELWPVYLNYGLISLIGIMFPLGAYLFIGDSLDILNINYLLTAAGLLAAGISIGYYLILKKIKPVVYASLFFILIVITLGFPLSNALLVNPDYKSIALVKDQSIPIYAIDDLAPELIWDLGERTTFKTIDQLKEYRGNEMLGVLTYYSTNKEALRELKDVYHIQDVITYDLNPVDRTRRSYKDRLKADLYILKRKSTEANK